MKQPALGVIIAGKYRLERPLASGGMGSVWVARHLELDVEIAIKFMGADLASTSEGRVRFQREAKAAAFLQSPYVVSVQDYGVDDELPYIVMELLKGEDLEDRLHRRKRLSAQETLTILSQISKALGRAHELGIIHRDLKPRNLFLASVHDEEIVKILDFGIAKQINTLNPGGATTTQQVIGSPHYMSPEQIRNVKDIDHRTDLWSLGVILFQTVTGKLPFSSEVLIDLLNKVISGPLPIASQIAPDLPPGMDDFFLRALTRDRSQRFQSVREMTEAFADLVRSSLSADRSSSAGTFGPLPTQGPAVTPAVTPAHVITPKPARSLNPEASTTASPLSATEPLPGLATRSDLETAQRPAVLELSRPPRSKGVSPKSAFAVAAVLACALAVGGVVGRLKGTGSQTQGEPLAEPQVSSGSAPAQRAEPPPAPISPPPATQNPQEVTVSPSAPASAASPSSSGSAANAVNSTVVKAPPPPGPTRNTGPTRPPPKPPAKKTSDEWGL